MFWKKWVTKQELESVHSKISGSFSKVKSDFSDVYEWLNYLYQENQELSQQLTNQNQLSEHQKQAIEQLKKELSVVPKTPEEIKKIIDSYYSYDNLLSRIDTLNQRLDSISAPQVQPQPQKVIQDPVHELRSRLDKLETTRSSTARERIVKRLTKNSKDYVQRSIINFIRKYNSISSTKLKEIVVEDQGLASKSSFYRIMELIEGLEEVGVVKKGKERHYFYKEIATR
tara:strand:+ start:364 stop:1047 length:684 start_codon:yes stop_codon:yes gene_type:complete